MPDTSPGWRGGVSSMRVRLTLAASLVTAVAVALAGWLLIRSVEDTQLGRLRERAERSVDLVADRLEGGSDLPEALEAGGGEAIVSSPRAACLVTVLSDDSRTVFCRSADGPPLAGPDEMVGRPAPSSGVVITTETLPPGMAPSGSSPGAPVGPGGAAGQADRGDPAAGEAGGGGGGDRPVGEIVSRQVETDAYGPLVVRALAPSGEVARSVEAVGNALWVLLPGLVGVVAVVAWWLTGRALRPVEAIRVEAEEIGGTTIHRRLPEPRRGDEIGRLARTMNAMLDRLEQSSLRQRQFVSDASHELRSPVAAIRTDLEVALHEGERADWPAVARNVLAEEGRLERLLGDMLVLASDDETSDLASRHATTVDLGQLAAAEAARGRDVPVACERPGDAGDDDLVVEGVASRLERVLANLVDNAARHAVSEVRVAVSRQGDRVRVVVDDDGPGIPAIDRERIFERFTRLDDSRARDRGGAGLGLAVVRSIVTRHGGYVWADGGPLGGARFTLELPAARP